MTTFAERVASFVVGAKPGELPPADEEAVERSFFDTVGVMLAGRTSPQGAIVERAVANKPPGDCAVIGSGLRRGAAAAALANGVFAHADDFDDMGGYGHPSAPIIAALLPVTEHEIARGREVTGTDLVLAYAVGFELGAALCSKGGYDQYERCFHSTPVFGALAATCAVARIMGLSEGQVMHALGIAASSAAGLGRSSGTMAKPFHAGNAARNAVYATAAARNGVTANPEVFEARGGFARAMFGHSAVPLNTIADGLGRPYTVAKTIFLKRFPCCGSNHSAASALELLIAEHALTPDQVERIVVHSMTETSPVLRFPVPDTGCSAKFSIQYVLGNLLVRGTLALDDFRDETVVEPAVRAVAARVETEVVNRWDMRGAAKHRGNPVTVYTTDGRVLQAAVPRTDIIGGPRTPYPEDDLREKFWRNAERSLSADRVADAIEPWRRIARQQDVRSLIDLVA